MIKIIDGLFLKELMVAASRLIEKNRPSIDALNVFPVPDGDTGINMSLTMMSAVKEVGARDIRSAGEVAGIVAKGALRGARGNSGVILSQLFRGFAKALDGYDEITTGLWAQALKVGAETASKAVLKPKEGTILTVARCVAEEAVIKASETDDFTELFRHIQQKGDEVLKKTPDMLPVLKQAGVVDAGGKGLMVVYAAFLAVVSEQGIDSVSFEFDFGTVAELSGASEPLEYAYCTELFIQSFKPDKGFSDIDELRAQCSFFGDCVLVVGDTELTKVHVHTNHPDKILQKALAIGELNNIKIDNMNYQHRSILDLEVPEPEDPKPGYKSGVVAVAQGSGLVDIFEGMAIDQVVQGGQTMNPSIDDIFQAIERVPASTVFVLPNNSNIIMAAQQAAQLSNKDVHVLSTKSVPQGIAAAVAYVPTQSDSENLARMEEAFSAVKTGQITYAVRATTYKDISINKGDIIGLIDGKIKEIGDNPEKVALNLLKGMVSDDTELITLFYGQDTPKETVQFFSKTVTSEYPDCDVTFHEGGQPLYFYLISVE